jgi:hypothetical protein
MRFTYIFLTIVACMSCGLQAAEKSDAKKETVEFDGQTLLLAFDTKNDDESLKEYIPRGEKLESWTKLASLHEYSKLNDPKATVDALVRLLKQQNPRAPVAVITNAKTGDMIVDFVTWPQDASFCEFNVFRYSKKPGGGLVAQQYALREYKDQEGFLKGLKPVRQRLVRLMSEEGIKVNK